MEFLSGQGPQQPEKTLKPALLWEGLEVDDHQASLTAHAVLVVCIDFITSLFSSEVQG